jgi:EAL domain-containing protein (putative c-di-GMP-specific phosphodiesterase class I)
VKNSKKKKVTPYKAESKPIIQHFSPQVKRAITALSDSITKSESGEHIVGVIKVQNVAAILYIHGEKVAKKALDGLVKYVRNCLEDDVKAFGVGLDKIIFVCKSRGKAAYITKIDNLLFGLGDYGSSLKGNPICFSLKIGAANFKNNSQHEFITGLDQAYMALYECELAEAYKHKFYDEIKEQVEEYQKQLRTAATFQSIIHHDRIKLAYQPVVDAKTGKVKSYEALLRFIDEDGQLNTAGYMIPIAEKYGFIDKIDLFVLKNAVKELTLNPEVHISLNVSNVSVHNKIWLKEAKKLLKDPKIAERVIVELTETGVQRNLQKIALFVESVQAMGCKVAIDDFGAGYTSFAQLKILDVDFVKIDGAFVKDIEENADSKLFVKTLQDFAKAFGVKTIAEFVETGNVAKTLMDLGVDYLQGYYFSKPVNYRPWINDDRII